MPDPETTVVVECDDVAGPATRGLACLLPTSDQRRDQATKEEILSRLAGAPATATQLARRIGLAAQGLYRHMRDLQAAGLVREAPAPSGRPRHERYYAVAFPIVTERDRERLMPTVSTLAQSLVQTYERHESALRQTYQGTELSREGWRFEDLALCILDEAERMARTQLVEEGTLPDSEGRVFWGREVAAEG